MLDAERALATRGRSRRASFPRRCGDAIAEACAAERYDWERAARAKAGRSANPSSRSCARSWTRVGEDTARFVHLGATTQDVMDTAAMLVARRALGLVLDELDRVTDACAALARDAPRHADGRPHAAAAGGADDVRAQGGRLARRRARRRARGSRELRDERLAAQLGGAAGTLAALGEHGPEIARLFAGELGLVEPTLPWHTNRVRIAELGAALDIAAGVVGEDRASTSCCSRRRRWRRCARAGEGGGSSAMPQKRNPVGCDAGARRRRARARARIRAHGRARPGARAGGRRLAGGVGGALGRAPVRGRRGRRAGRSRSRGSRSTRPACGRTSTSPAGQIAAERIAVVLTERLGRTAARTLVRDASLRAERDRALARATSSSVSTPGLTPEEIRDALEPTTYLGSAGALVDRALARYEAERVAAE